MIYSVIILFIEECDLFWSEDVTPAELIEVDEDCLPAAATDAGPPRHGQTGPLAPASFPLGPLPAQHNTQTLYFDSILFSFKSRRIYSIVQVTQ